MKEELISFETAKLAKEKGCNLSTNYYFPDDIDVKEPMYNSDKICWIECSNQYAAPTQSLLQKWLRENFKLWVWVVPDKFNGKGLCTYYIESEDESITINKYSYPKYKSWGMANKDYYEALEKGLQEALKLIK